jgi:hypothetical protein
MGPVVEYNHVYTHIQGKVNLCPSSTNTRNNEWVSLFSFLFCFVFFLWPIFNIFLIFHFNVFTLLFMFVGLFFFPNFFLSRVVRWFTVRCPRWSTERRSPWVCLYDFCFLKISQSYSLDCCWLLFCGWASGFCSFMFSVYKKNTHTHTKTTTKSE